MIIAQTAHPPTALLEAGQDLQTGGALTAFLMTIVTPCGPTAELHRASTTTVSEEAS
jgi:hypothetical protein